jgi:hypothetical protein
LHIEDEGFKKLKHVKHNRLRPAMQRHGPGSEQSSGNADR